MTMRDFDRVREKIEIRLEPRQVVGLAIGIMALAGGVFAAGYWAGARTVAPVAPTTVADLGEVDAAPVPEPPKQQRALGEVEFLFPSALASRPARKKPVRKTVKLAPAKVSAKVEGQAKAPKVKAPEPAPVPRKRPLPVVKLKPKPEVKLPLAAAPKRRAPEPIAQQPAPPSPSRAVVAPAPVAKARPKAAVFEDEDSPVERPREAVSNRAYTLQVKASSSKSEVDRFAKRLRKSGFDPHIVLSTVPGKGRYYRVRLGKFESVQAARTFQRKYKASSGQPDGGFVTDL